MTESPLRVIWGVCALASIALGATSGCANCGGGGAQLVVSLKTDLRAGLDFAEVRTFVFSGPPENELGGRGELRMLRADRDDSFAVAARVAELDLDPGIYGAHVRLIAAGGSVIAHRLVQIDLEEGTTLVTVVIASDCAGVECPGTGDPPEAIACNAGRCVRPECIDDPTLCGAPECTGDGDCPGGPPCVSRRCDLGICFGEPHDERCAAGEWCSVTLGCQPLPGGGDSGPIPMVDSGPTPMVDSGPLPGCGSDSECPARSFGGWSGCGGFSGMCGEDGTESRDVTSYHCTARTCTEERSTESRGCRRDTRGMRCRGDEIGGWSACDYGDTCDDSATRSREITSFACAGGSCEGSVRTENEGCSRSTEGAICASDGSYCGTPIDCHVCRGGACVLNSPDFDGACNPSCGRAQGLCGGSALCCGRGTSCSSLGPGPWADCAVCCDSFCF